MRKPSAARVVVLGPVWHELPRSAQRLSNRHKTESGLLLVADFPRYRGHLGTRENTVIRVAGVEGTELVTLTLLHRGPAWIPLHAGENGLTFSSRSGVHSDEFERGYGGSSSVHYLVRCVPPRHRWLRESLQEMTWYLATVGAPDS